MKKIVFLLLCIPQIFFSQEIDIKKSEIFKDPKKNSSLSFSVEDNNGGVITIRHFLAGFPVKEIKRYYIQHFDKDLSLIKDYTYEVKRNRIKSAFVSDGKLNFIEYEKVNFKDDFVYSIVTSSIAKFDFSSKEILKISEDNVEEVFGYNIFKNAKFDANRQGGIIQSKNNNYFAINVDTEDKGKETRKFFVFDKKGNLKYSKLFTEDIKDKLFELNSVDIDDNNGAIYFVAKVFENNSTKKKKKDGTTNYHFEVYKLNEDGVKKVNFDNPEKFIGSLVLIIDDNNDVSCVGFYGDKKEHKYNGVCYFKLNSASLNIESNKFSPFSEEFMKDKYGDNENKINRKAKKGLKNIVFKKITPLPNGDVVISAEEDYITVHTTYINGMVSTYVIQHYDDIITMRLDNSGNIKWARNINKAQTGYDNSSFTALSLNDTSYYFINCSDKIKELSGNRIHFNQTSAKKSNLYCISIKNDGEVNTQKLIDDKDSKMFYKVNQGITSDKKKNEAIFLGKRKKESQIIKVSIN